MSTLTLIWYWVEPATLTSLDSIELFDQSAGFALAYNGFTRALANRDRELTIETFTLRVDAASYDDLAAVLREFDLWQKRVADSSNEVEYRQVWIKMQIGDETESYQAQVTALDYGVEDDLLNYAAPHINKMRLVIEHTSWEALGTEFTTLTDITGLSVLGGMDRLTETVGGDLPARPLDIELYPSSAHNEFWIAFRTALMGSLADWVPVWPLYASDSGARSADTVETTDANTYDGTRLTCDFSTTENAVQRVMLQMQDVGAWAGTKNTAHDAQAFYASIGHFGVLLRARMSAAGEAHVRIGYGWGVRADDYTIYNPIWRDIVVVSGTSYRLYDMQDIAIPPDGAYVSQTNFSILVEAERVSGSASLYLDCLGLVPLDEGALHIYSEHDVADRIRVLKSPTGKISGQVLLGSYLAPERELVDAAQCDAEIWSLPTHTSPPAIIAFAQTTTASSITATLSIAGTFVQRYRFMRGTT